MGSCVSSVSNFVLSVQVFVFASYQLNSCCCCCWCSKLLLFLVPTSLKLLQRPRQQLHNLTYPFSLLLLFALLAPVGCQLFGEQLLSYVHMAVNWCRVESCLKCGRQLINSCSFQLSSKQIYCIHLLQLGAKRSK